MLEELRDKSSSSWFNKIILGIIAIVFILYFGSSFVRRNTGGSGPSSPAAQVNGHNIPRGKVEQLSRRQISLYEQFGSGKLPQEQIKAIQQQVLQSLVHSILFADAAEDLGLRVTDQEIADEIRKNPGFQKDGQFIESFYLNQFKPNYEKRNGEDFEYTLKEELSSDKLRKVIQAAAVSSITQTNDQDRLKQIQMNLRQLSIPAKSLKPEKPEEQAQAIAQQWIQLKKSGKAETELPKEWGASESETGLRDLNSLLLSLGDSSKLELFNCLLTLKNGEFCEKPFLVKDNWLALQLIEKKNSEPNLEAAKASLDRLGQIKQNQLTQEVQALLVKNAKVEMFTP